MLSITMIPTEAVLSWNFFVPILFHLSSSSFFHLSHLTFVFSRASTGTKNINLADLSSVFGKLICSRVATIYFCPVIFYKRNWVPLGNLSPQLSPMGRKILPAIELAQLLVEEHEVYGEKQIHLYIYYKLCSFIVNYPGIE